MSAQSPRRRVYVAGTCDTKGPELAFVKSLIAAQGVGAALVDLSTQTARASSASVDISADEVASHHPGGAMAVFTGDRGSAVTAMAEAFTRFMTKQDDPPNGSGLATPWADHLGTRGRALIAMRSALAASPS